MNCYRCWESAAGDERELNLRPFAAGLASRERVTTDMMALVLLLLATVTFDGVRSTPFWTDVRDNLFGTASTLFGVNAVIAIDSMGLLLIPTLFLATYLFFSWAMALASGREATPAALARAFVFSLVPIALAYNIAHFFTLLVINGQLIIPLASDPFGYGWDLLGTAGYVINPGVVSARATWLLSVSVIVSGAHSRRVPGPRHRHTHHRRYEGCPAEPVPHAGTDGWIHHRQPVDYSATHRGIGAVGQPSTARSW